MATASLAKASGVSLQKNPFDGPLAQILEEYFASERWTMPGRETPNWEDYIHAAQTLAAAEQIRGSDHKIGTAVTNALHNIRLEVIQMEQAVQNAWRLELEKPSGERILSSQAYPISFVLSFASRSATRERLNIFSLNYDRLMEHLCDVAGLQVLDRFTGALNPIFRSSRLSLDLHYNPPGIRGEPRYLEGVVRLTKLHGSIDWRWEDQRVIASRLPLGYEVEGLTGDVLIYPHAAKDVETSAYPYSELFRDFSATVCRPNSSLVVYGYSFGDSHINAVIRDMLTIHSTHLVIIAYDDPNARIEQFVSDLGRPAQITILKGNHFADLRVLVEHYLPKPAIDVITFRMNELIRRRRLQPDGGPKASEQEPEESK